MVIVINSIEQLDNMHGDLTEDYELGKDLDFNDDANYDNPANKPVFTTGDGWTPIGDNVSGFSGSFDGKGYTISNLYINRGRHSYCGFFGWIAPTGIIKNIGLLNVSIFGQTFVGSLIGNNGGRVQNCYIEDGTVGCRYRTGRVGGFCGSNQLADAHISCCYAKNVTVTGGDYTGGFVGYNYYYCLIEQCYATGNVYSHRNACGGFVGGTNGSSSIQNSFSTGKVTRTAGTGTAFGGFCGQNARSTILRSYSTGAVEYDGAPNPTNKGFCGGIAYFQGGGECVWDTETSGQTSTADTLSTGKTTLEAQNRLTYTSMLINWDIAEKHNWLNEIWWIESGIGYPMLACCYEEPEPTARSKVKSIHQDRNVSGGSSTWC